MARGPPLLGAGPAGLGCGGVAFERRAKRALELEDALGSRRAIRGLFGIPFRPTDRQLVCWGGLSLGHCIPEEVVAGRGSDASVYGEAPVRGACTLCCRSRSDVITTKQNFLSHNVAKLRSLRGSSPCSHNWLQVMAKLLSDESKAAASGAVFLSRPCISVTTLLQSCRILC